MTTPPILPTPVTHPNITPPARIAARFTVLGLAAVCAVVMSISTLPADAKKKKKKPKINEEEVKAAIEPVQKTVLELTKKIQTRLLITPEENGQLDDVKWQLMDLMAQYAKSNLIVQPVYQAAVLFERREYHQDAYDMYTFLEDNHPENPVTQRAKLNKYKLEKRYGKEAFALAPEPPEASDTDTATAAPAVAEEK